VTTGDNSIHVVIAADPSYLPWAATAMLSALDRHRAGTLEFHLLHDGRITPIDASRLADSVTEAGGSIRLYPVRDERIDSLRPPHSGSYATWFRLVVADLLPDLPRALLLDADTFVADGLEALWSTQLHDAPLAAVANVIEPSRRGHPPSLGIEDPHQYLNAGVLLLDLDRLRWESAPARLLRFASENASRIWWLDQDALNVVFAGRWQPLHPRWNAMNSLWVWPDWAEEVFGADAVREATTAPGILHFEGPAMFKPWHYLSDHRWRREYRDTLARTPWAGTPLDDDSAIVRLISRLPSPWRIPAYWKWVRVRERLQRGVRRRSSSRSSPARPGTTRSSS
jgi:lipopolysaccharide biosynthesis glycosyltransferase